jgi:hypothetical protein
MPAAFFCSMDRKMNCTLLERFIPRETALLPE